MAKGLTVRELGQESFGRSNMKQVSKVSLSLNVNFGTAGVKLIFKLDLKNVFNFNSILVLHSAWISEVTNEFPKLGKSENDHIETYEDIS